MSYSFKLSLLTLFIILATIVCCHGDDEIEDKIKQLACPFKKSLLQSPTCLEGEELTKEACEKRFCCYYKHHLTGEESCLKPKLVDDITDELSNSYKLISASRKKSRQSLSMKTLCTLYNIGCSSISNNRYVNADPEPVESCRWQVWSAWGTCKQGCYEKFRTRFRRCTCLNPGVQCNGADMDYKKCTESFETDCGYWTGWGAYGACSASCGAGVRQRSRTCAESNPGEGNCIGPVSETVPCESQRRLNAEFSDWTSCSATCGEGIQTRTAVGICGADINEKRSCKINDCCSNLPWSEWSQCSSSCGEGSRMRSRQNTCNYLQPELDFAKCNGATIDSWMNWTGWSICTSACLSGTRMRTRGKICSSQQEKQNEKCGTEGEWSDYTQWSVCSKSCGGGSRSRIRYYSCPEDLASSSSEDRQVEACNSTPCCSIGSWSNWSSCSVSCGSGVQTRSRSYEGQCALTLGRQTESNQMVCYADPGSWQQWSPFGSCSSTCNGRKTRQRTHSCTGMSQFDSESCGVNTALAFKNWGQWSDCSRSCGGGSRVRSRTNACSGQTENEKQICNTDPGYYLTPGSWSTCSSSCSGGTQYRESLHTCGLPVKREVQACGNTGSYSNWSMWSQCSSTCSGQKTRSKTNSCGGAPIVENESCGSGGQFGSWSKWSVCSQYCSGGTRRRSRLHSCGLPADIETEPCGRGPFFNDWSSWSSCTKTCGGGSTTRVRRGMCGAENQSENKQCGEASCCVINSWGTWGSCSVSCGVGERVRYQTSTCSAGQPVDVQTEACNSGEGYFVDQWSRWSECTSQCGGGLQERTRTHSCKGVVEETQACNEMACARFDMWGPWGSCSSSCSRGVKRRNRRCIDGLVGAFGCSGRSVEVADCVSDASAISWQQWSYWSTCTASCGGGTHSRSRSHPCLETETEVEACNVNPGAYGEWTAWTSCTKSCGGGLQYRERTHSCTLQTEKQTQQCNTDLGTFYEWSTWSICSATCGQSFRTRVRGHSCGGDGDMEVEICNAAAETYTDWSQWSSCSQSCNDGVQIRTRYERCANTPDTQTQPCFLQVCTYWTAWSSWGACSSSCSDGVQMKTRTCRRSGTVLANACEGESTVTRSCSNQINREKTYSSWKFTTPCSVTCGEGTRQRRRDSLCGGPQIETVTCYAAGSQMSEWSTWSSCSASCGLGEQTRTRRDYCSNKLDSESKPCSGGQGGFDSWTKWSTCTKQCGGGTQDRARVNSCTNEVQTGRQNCNTLACGSSISVISGSQGGSSVISGSQGGSSMISGSQGGSSMISGGISMISGGSSMISGKQGGSSHISGSMWENWSEWSPCSVTCGGGFVIREKKCKKDYEGSASCRDTPIERKSCNLGTCCEMNWNNWMGCCRSDNLNMEILIKGNRCTRELQYKLAKCTGTPLSTLCTTNIALLRRSGFRI